GTGPPGAGRCRSVPPAHRAAEALGLSPLTAPAGHSGGGTSRPTALTPVVRRGPTLPRTADDRSPNRSSRGRPGPPVRRSHQVSGHRQVPAVGEDAVPSAPGPGLIRVDLGADHELVGG